VVVLEQETAVFGSYRKGPLKKCLEKHDD